MKRLIEVAFVLIVVFATEKTLVAQDKQFRKIENKAFNVGEKLSFDVNFGFITAGKAYMEIPSIKKISGRDTYNVVFRVNSVSTFDPFYKVRDRYETYIDTEGIFPWRFEQHIREGSFSRDFSAYFDQRNGKAFTKKGSYAIPENVNDIVSAFYYVRTLNFANAKVGDTFHLENFFKDKVHPLDVIYRGKEKVTVSAGTFNCFIVEPLVVEGGLFKNEGSIIIWLSDDELKIPVKVKTKVLIGSIDAELTKYEGLAGKLVARVK